MQLYDLPDDVLMGVLRASCIDKDPYKDLNDNLRLLAISRRLRHLALPLVYRTAYLRCSEKPPVDSTGESSSTIDTSLSLIAAIGCVDLVRVVRVAVCRGTETPWALLEVANVVRDSASLWPRVESLSISAMTSDNNDGDIAGVRGHDSDDVCSAAEALSSLFPRVRRLTFYGEDEGNIIGLYYGQLAGHYAEQLEELQHCYNIALPRDIYFQRLRLLYFTCGATSDYAFPRVNPATLEEMCIYEVPASLDLDAFGASDDSPDIVFSELKVLVLMYRSGSSGSGSSNDNNNMQVARQDSPPWRLHLPQARVISLYRCQSRCPFIENAVFPAAVHSFSIAGSAVLLTAVAAKQLPTTQNLELEVADHRGNTRGVFAAINTILSSMRPCKKAALDIADESLSVLSEDISFTGVTELYITSPTSVRTVIELVQKLPQLVCLITRNCTIGDTPPEVVTPTPDEPELLPPFDTRIETLGLSGVSAGVAFEQGARVWQYMLLRIPSLTGVCLYGVSREAFGVFVSNYSRRYPHLSSIRKLY